MDGVATYDPSLLRLEPSNARACLMWVRFWLRDKPDAEGKPGEHHLSDAEIMAALELAAVGDSVRYYRPHITAKALLVGNPELWETKRFRDYSETRREPEEIAEAWAAQGAALDARIPAELLPGRVAKAAKPRYYSRVSRFKVHF